MRTALIATQLRADARTYRRRGWSVRLRARLRAGRYDHDLDSGNTTSADDAMALHAARIVTPGERERLAAALADRLYRAHGGARPASARIPLYRQQILTNSALIEDIAGHLRGPEPVRARGVARLRLLLADGTGPLYTTGTGSAAAALRGVIAAL